MLRRVPNFAPALAGVAAALALGGRCPAAEPEFTPVTLTTGDGVELSGRYAPGRLGRNSPAVIVLDDLGGAADPRRCADVGSRLAAAGCAVLLFDFRGHGGSTAVTPDFWADPTNRRLVRGYSPTRPKDRIGHADFRTGYLPSLVNDVAAARAFLERRNDAGECNAGQLFLVGFGRGATLGTLWLGAEWQRYRGLPGYPVRLAPSPEGGDVAGCVWVGIAPSLDRRPGPLAAAAARAERKRSVLFGLVHRADDAAAAGVAADWGRRFNDDAERTTLVVARPVAGGEAGTPAARAAEIDAVVDLLASMRKVQAAPPWDERDFTDGGYYWAVPGGRPVPAKGEGEEWFRPVPAGAVLGPQ